MWRWQLREERKKKSAEHIFHAIHLAINSLTYVRCLLYSKTQGIKGVLNLPENPVDELMAIATLHLHEIVPLVRQLHNKQQELFAHGIEGPNAGDSIIRLANAFPAIVNQLTAELEEMSEVQGTRA